jgi:aconitate hydratase
MLAVNGTLADLISAGARILECACGPCIGMGQSPNSGGVSLRTFNRNFEGRSGTKDGQVYLVSPETAAVAAITGEFTPPGEFLGKMPVIEQPAHFLINDNMITPPADENESAAAEILRGPNIKPFPVNKPLAEKITANVLLKAGDNITTDHIMPAGAKILPLRSNIPAISEYCFTAVDETFPKRAKVAGTGIIAGGINYGQGSSREHAALAPLYLGIKVVICKSFARIHRQNLINSGIIPLTFKSADDYEEISEGDVLALPSVRAEISDGKDVTIVNTSSGKTFAAECETSERTRRILLAGGLLNFTKQTK